jgi:hypothetical protein
MIAVIENRDTNRVVIISAYDANRLRSQIEKFLDSNLSSTAWAKLYVDMETADLGQFMITLFELNSIIEIKPIVMAPHLGVTREDHNLKPRD